MCLVLMEHHQVRQKRSLTLNTCGASAGSVLCGSGLNNQGLRLQVSQEQPRGNEGAINGGFVILDVGTNMHSQSLNALLNRMTDGAEVLSVIRQQHAGCVNIANANILVLEQTKQLDPLTSPGEAR